LRGRHRQGVFIRNSLYESLGAARSSPPESKCPGGPPARSLRAGGTAEVFRVACTSYLMERLSSNVDVRQDLTLSLVTQGDQSAPTVVFLPGPTDSWRSYERVLDALPPSIRAVAVSQRGHGDS